MAGRIEVAGARYTVHGMYKGEIATKVEDAVKNHQDFGIRVNAKFHRFLMQQTSGVLHGIMVSAMAGRVHPVLRSYMDGVRTSMLKDLFPQGTRF